MSEVQANRRIDAGIKRGPRPGKLTVKPSDMERKARDEAGRFLTRYTPETKAKAIEEALIALEAGGRIEEIADKHQIPTSTMYSWLIGTDASKLRTQFFDGQCVRNLTEIRSSESPLELARAREELSGWLKVAAVRDSGAYGPRLSVESKQVMDPATQELATAATELLRHFREKVVNPEPIALDNKDIGHEEPT